MTKVTAFRLSLWCILISFLGCNAPICQVSASCPGLKVTKVGSKMQFTPIDVGEKDLVFYLYSDGYYQVHTGHTPALRKFNSSATKEVKMYVARKGKPVERHTQSFTPQISTVDATLKNPVQSLNNEPIALSTSWNAPLSNLNSGSCAGEDDWFFLIVSFQNTTTITQSGKVKVEYGNLGKVFNYQGVIANYEDSNNWISNVKSTSSTFTFNYASLTPNEERHVFVTFKRKASIPAWATEFSKIDIKTTMKMNRETATTEFPLLLSVLPWDPNSLSVNKDVICCAYKDKLIYKIDFQNMGNGYAKDVIVDMPLPPQLIVPSIAKIKTSHPSSHTIQNGHKLHIKFKNINLPGLNQAVPHAFNQEDSKGWVIFTINKQKCLNPKFPIEAQAIITFPQAPKPNQLATNKKIVELLPSGTATGCDSQAGCPY